MNGSPSCSTYLPSFPRMRKFLFLAAASLLLGFSGLTSAQETQQPELKYYDVEVIIFKNLSVPTAHEFNLPTPSASRQHNTLDLADPVSVQKATELGFSVIPVEELRLQDSVSNIIKSSRYSLLLHTGWRQPGLDEANSVPVWIKGGRVYDKRYSSIDQVTDIEDARQPQNLSGQQEMADAKPLSDSEDLGTAKAVKPYSADYLYELEGQITIVLSRYLHTRAELVFRKPAEPGNLLMLNEDPQLDSNSEDLVLEGQLLLNYALNEQRRMRSKKLHYLDHPEFGMLVLITPYEAPEQLPQDTENPAETQVGESQSISNPDNG